MTSHLHSDIVYVGLIPFLLSSAGMIWLMARIHLSRSQNRGGFSNHLFRTYRSFACYVPTFHCCCQLSNAPCLSEMRSQAAML